MVVVTAAQQLSVAGIQSDSCTRGNAHQGSCGSRRSPVRWSIQTWSWKRVHLLVGDRHDGVLQLLQDFRDGLVGQERRHRCEQQVDEDEEDGEEVLHAQFTESPRSGAFVFVIYEQRMKPVSKTCERRRRAAAEAGLPSCDVLSLGSSSSGLSMTSSKKFGMSLSPSSSSSSSMNCGVKEQRIRKKAQKREQLCLQAS